MLLTSIRGCRYLDTGPEVASTARGSADAASRQATWRRSCISFRSFQDKQASRQVLRRGTGAASAAI